MGVEAEGRPHVPVLLEACLDLLKPARGGVFVDCTLGAGGHARAVLDLLPADGRLICLDQDQRAHDEAHRQKGPPQQECRRRRPCVPPPAGLFLFLMAP